MVMVMGMVVISTTFVTTITVTMVNTMTSRLNTMTCAGCGHSIAQLPAGTHGITCTGCGTVNHPFNTGEPTYAFDLSDDEDDAQPMA